VVCRYVVLRHFLETDFIFECELIWMGKQAKLQTSTHTHTHTVSDADVFSYGWRGWVSCNEQSFKIRCFDSGVILLDVHSRGGQNATRKSTWIRPTVINRINTALYQCLLSHSNYTSIESNVFVENNKQWVSGSTPTLCFPTLPTCSPTNIVILRYWKFTNQQELSV